MELNIDFTNTPLLVVGWGKVSEDGDYSDKLREVYLPFVDYEECIENYNSDLITDAHLCAGELDKDSCYGLLFVYLKNYKIIIKSLTAFRRFGWCISLFS